MGQNCARGLEYQLRSVLETRDLVFSLSHQPRLVNNFVFYAGLLFSALLQMMGKKGQNHGLYCKKFDWLQGHGQYIRVEDLRFKPAEMLQKK